MIQILKWNGRKIILGIHTEQNSNPIMTTGVIKSNEFYFGNLPVHEILEIGLIYPFQIKGPIPEKKSNGSNSKELSFSRADAVNHS